MQKLIIEELIDTYFNATGITTFFIDKSLEFHDHRMGLTRDELDILDLKEILQFLDKTYSKDIIELENFYTYITKNNFIYNIKLLIEEDGIFGSIVSGAMLLHNPLEYQVNIIYDQYKNKISRNEMVDILSKLNIITLVQVNSLGKLLASIVKTTESNIIYQQILQWKLQLRHEPNEEIENILKISMVKHFNKEKMISPNAYNLVRDLVSSGNICEMRQFISNLCNNTFDQIIPENSIQSARIFCITILTACFCFTREANVPYQPMMEIAYNFMRQVEKENTLYDLLNLIKTILETYTHAVANYSYRSYSKPVKLVMKYIHNNFQRKITLKELSDHIGLSTFYLSSIIKKETFLSLTDNINKIRVEESKYLLLNTDASILDIAQRTGFSYQNHYSSVFKKFEGKTPYEFRKEK